jgi:ribosomal protein S18 acetylase RimI-like enzyme
MAYAQIEITEVGPAEYPLLKVLRDTIFGEFNHRYANTFDEVIEGRQDVLALMAHLEGNPVGYKIGYRERPRHYHSWTGGVLKDYRGQGVARRMQEWQHAWLRARGYQTVGFNSFNKFGAMMRFGLATGFVPDAVNIRPENELAIHFTKDLTKPDPPRREKAAVPTAVHVEAVGPNYHGLIAQIATETVLEHTEEQIDRAMANRDSLALVAFVDNRPVGFKTGWGRDPMRFYYHSHMGGVLPEYRGMGVATALARHQLRTIAGMGYRKVGYFTKHDNIPMIRMALGLGFGFIGMQFKTQERFAQVMLERDITPADRE